MAGKLDTPRKRGFRILAVDFGTTRCKTSVVGGRGEILATFASENNLRKRDEGVYEQDAAEFAASLAACVKKTLGAARGELDAVVVTGQGSAPVCLGESGTPVGPVISHLDTRADAQRERMREEAGELGYVCAKIFPNLLWIKENVPERFKRIRSVFDVREYVGYLLTGESKFDANAVGQQRIDRLAALVGLDPDVFGSPHDWVHPIGTTSVRAKRNFGIGREVPVLQAPVDTVCAAIGSGLGEGSVVADVTGSTEVVAVATRSNTGPRTSRLYLIPHAEEGRAFLFMSPPHGFVFKWFVDTFYAEVNAGERYACLDREVSMVSPSEKNPLFIPLIRTGDYSYKIECEFLGVGVSHKRANLARAVMEGLAMRVKTAVEDIRDGGARVEAVRLSGGGAKSGVWNQIRTDVFGVRTEMIQTLETSSLGAAMVASVALSNHRNFSEAERAMVHVTKSYSPRPGPAEVYGRMCEKFVRRTRMLEASRE